MAGREAAVKMEAVTENSIFQQMLNEKMEVIDHSCHVYSCKICFSLVPLQLQLRVAAGWSSYLTVISYVYQELEQSKADHSKLQARILSLEKELAAKKL